MIFASWTYDGSKLNLTLVGDKGDLSNYMENRSAIFENICILPMIDSIA